MMKVELVGEWQGLDGLGDAALGELRPRAEATVLRVVQRFHEEMMTTLSGPRHGRVYERGERTVRFLAGSGQFTQEVGFVVNRGSRAAPYTASAPGEAPASPTGRLRGSIAFTAPVWDRDTVSSEIGTNLVYARRLEFGGIDSRGVKIEARPYWAPTVLRMEPIAEQMFEAGL